MANPSGLWCAVVVASGTVACAGLDFGRKSDAPASPAVTKPLPAVLEKVPPTGLELVPVKGGCFQMGNTFEAGGPEEKPVHEVCVDAFSIGTYEVTQRLWKAVMGSNPSFHVACGDDCPVEMVSWNDVQEFLGRLNARDGGKGSPAGSYRLPTEAEWEYAARSGGKNEKYPGGTDDLDAVAWRYGGADDTRPVGQKVPNGLGLHDMAGNVWEWTSDWYGEAYYAISPRDNPTGPASGDRRVVRGGSFANDAFDLRTSYRNYLPPDSRGFSKGFRLVRSAPAPSK
jgi:sulfatase modifying factor 1